MVFLENLEHIFDKLSLLPLALCGLVTAVYDVNSIPVLLWSSSRCIFPLYLPLFPVLGFGCCGFADFYNESAGLRSVVTEPKQSLRFATFHSDEVHLPQRPSGPANFRYVANVVCCPNLLHELETSSHLY